MSAQQRMQQGQRFRSSKPSFGGGRIIDSLTHVPLPSAVISVVSRGGSRLGTVRNFATNNKGEFRFSCTVDRQNRMEISFLGYKLRTVLLDTDTPECNIGDIPMVEDAHQIDNVVIKARMEMYRMKGDTTIFLPRSVKTMEGDKALEILRHMPGVEVSDDGSVKVMGETVSRTYVNDKLLFGEDPRTALMQLEASEVASIHAYNEEDDTDFSAPKRKVINVVTFKKFAKSLSASALAEAGADFRKDIEGKLPIRYHVAGEGGYFSEKLQTQVKASTDNRPKSGILGIEPGTHRATKAEAAIAGAPNSKHNYRLNYYFDNDRSNTSTSNKQEYFPTSLYATQQQVGSSTTEGRKRQHYLTANYGYSSDKWRANTYFSTTIADQDAARELLRQTIRDQRLFSTQAQHSTQRGDEASYGGGVNLSRQFNKTHALSMSLSASRRNKQNNELRRELLQTDPQTNTTELALRTSIPHTSILGGLQYTLDADQKGSFKLEADVEYKTEENDIDAVDIITNTPDMALSQGRRDRSLYSNPKASYTQNRDAHSFSIDLGYGLYNNSYQDQLLGTPKDKRLFHAPKASLYYRYEKPSSEKRLSASLSNSIQAPHGEALSTRIDNNNLLFLSTGNPSLRASMYYNAQFDGTLRGKKQSSIEFKLQSELWTDAWVLDYILFAQGSILKEYHDYIVPAGATLQRTINAGNRLRLRGEVSYKTRINPLKCFFMGTARYWYENPQAMLDGELGRTHDHRAELEVGLTTNISSTFRIIVQSASEYRWYKNINGYTDRGLRERLTANLRWDFLGRFLLTTNYTMELYRTSFAQGNRTDHLLNLSLGCRVLNRLGTITLNAYDILNRNSGFSVTQSTLATSYTWQRMHTSYFTVAFEYKFKNRK